MPLQIHYTESTGPGTAHYQAVGLPLSWDRELEPGQLASERVVEVAQQFAATALSQLGITVEYSTDPADYPPSEPEPEPDAILQLYLDRAAAAPRVMARWAAGNELRLTSYVPPTNPFTQQPMLEPDPNDYETDEEYDAAVSAWMIFYNPDTHGWAPNLFASFMQEVGPVVILLNSLAFGATAQAVQAFSHPLATTAAKAAYLADMAAEGAMP